MVTASGAQYELDFDAMTLQRKCGNDMNHLRRDEEPIEILEVVTLQQGIGADFWLDVVRDGLKTRTFRATTVVKTLERISD